MTQDLLKEKGVIWRDGDKTDSYVHAVPNDNRGMHGSHHQLHNEKGERIWVDPNDKRFVGKIEEKGFDDPDEIPTGRKGLRSFSRSIQGTTRGFNWTDSSLGVTKVVAYPDKPIPGLHCPDCHCQAVETDQVGVALCSGTPGWYFYYRQRTNGIGQPEPKMEIVNGELKEVLKDKDIVIERVPDGSFREVKPDGELGKEVPKERVKGKE